MNKNHYGRWNYESTSLPAGDRNWNGKVRMSAVISLPIFLIVLFVAAKLLF